MKRTARLSACLLLLSVALTLPAPTAGAAAEAAGEPDPQTFLARELARLDERLELDTYPDGTGGWLARMAAALEYRLRPGSDLPAAAPDLMRRLAWALRALGVEHDLHGIPSEPPEAGRAERVEAALAEVRRLHAKLDGPAESPAALPAALPANDACPAAIALAGDTVAGTTAGATSDGTASCGFSTGAPDVWFRYTAASAGLFSFDTFGSSIDTVLSVTDGCVADGPVTELACNDDADGTLQSRISLSLAAGQEVWVRVSGYGGRTGAFLLTAAPDCGIRGTITDAATGDPLAGVVVDVYRYSSHAASGTSAADGTYTVGGLEAGTYHAQTDNALGLLDETWDDIPCTPWAACWVTDGTPIPVGEGEVSGIDFALAEAGAISGTITDAVTSQPLSGYVTLFSIDGFWLDTFYTDSSGSYRISGVHPGKYHLQAESVLYRRELYDDVPCTTTCPFDSATAVHVLASETAEADFALDRLATVGGTVVEDPSGTPVAGGEVIASNGTSTRYAYLSSTGTYQLTGLMPGTYSVRTSTPLHLDEVYDDIACPGSCSGVVGTPVAASLNAQTSGIDFALRQLGAIAGKVVHGPTGAPVRDATVVAWTSNGSHARTAYTRADGSYELEGLPAGSYRVGTRTSSYADEMYDDVACPDSCDPAVGADVDVVLGATVPGVDFHLDQLPVLSGSVFAADSGYGMGAQVVAYDASGAAVAQSSAYGGFRMTVPPGSYRVAAQPFSYEQYQGEVFDNVPCDPSCDPTLGTPLVVGLNSSLLGIKLVLEPCPADSYTSVTGSHFLSVHQIEACELLTAGLGTAVEPGAEVTLKAGRRVHLGSGFAVRAGGRLHVLIEPAWAQP
ncbi:MAG TPA: carboxypeptidase-like regulatory domain-containing protein [Thermoanaerobaculia bacterium]|nr:carboxypeptidase-like regulatory domain-containing protein [Thermoanaerobaculia bacterium]